MVMDMIRKCKICEKVFETKSSTRIYCYECSGNSIRSDNETRKHQKTKNFLFRKQLNKSIDK